MNRPKILITAATGTVGQEVVKSLAPHRKKVFVRAGNRNPASLPDHLQEMVDETVAFDFAQPDTFPQALENIDILFLLRPPQLADVPKYFAPLVAAAERAQVEHVVFLSVQGADDNSAIPHHKIEKLLEESRLGHTFLRPAYFFQNFLTTLHDDLVNKKRIFLPAGKASFTVIDVRDIGDVAAAVMLEPDMHRGQAYDLTAQERLTFGEMAERLSKGLHRLIRYVSPNPLWFYFAKRRAGVSHAMALVMIMLHFLPRFQSPPPISDEVQRITGHPPRNFMQFVQDHRKALRGY